MTGGLQDANLIAQAASQAFSCTDKSAIIAETETRQTLMRYVMTGQEQLASQIAQDARADTP